MPSYLVPETVAIKVREALAESLGWLESLHPTSSRAERVQRLRVALIALRECTQAPAPLNEER